jgi:hypothetical protein
MKMTITTLALILTSAVQAQGLGAALGNRIGDVLNSGKKTATVTYEHKTEQRGTCEKRASELAEQQSIAKCQQEFKGECKLLGKAAIVKPEEELESFFAPIEKYTQYETNDERECEGKALEQAKAIALTECQKSYSVASQCAVISSRISAPVSRTVHTSTFGGMFKKYKCNAVAVAQPQVNGDVVYTCQAQASAKLAKAFSWRDLLNR